MLNKVPHVSEKLLVAASQRRRLLSAQSNVGLKVVGPGKCRDTMLVREFLSKNLRANSAGASRHPNLAKVIAGQLGFGSRSRRLMNAAAVIS